MPHAKAQSRKGLWQAALAIAASSLVSSSAWAQEAVLADGTRYETVSLFAAHFDATTSEATLSVEGTTRDASGLVRWGEPAPPARRPGVVLADGSRLLADRPWSPNGLVQIDEQIVRLRRGKGWTDFDRNTVRWVLLSPGTAGLDPEQLPELPPGSDDVILLADGDRITGQITSLSAGTLTVAVAGRPIETPLENVAAVRLADAGQQPETPACLVGLDDGSLLRASRLALDEINAEITLGTIELRVGAEALAFVQPFGGSVRYLSDMEPVDYRHTPYLDLAWPYTRDRGLRGGPLTGGGRRAAKGVAMHSAARLVYRLDGSSQRFQAELAVADPEPGSAPTGSVAFRVYLVKDGGFQAAYEGPTQRVGDPAVPIDLDATGAAAIALVIDYAEGGDAGDDALWLDARLVKTP